MSYIVTEDFWDWDGFKISAGTIVESLVKASKDRKGRQFYNLIDNGRVVAITLGQKPPVSTHNPEKEE